MKFGVRPLAAAFDPVGVAVDPAVDPVVAVAVEVAQLAKSATRAERDDANFSFDVSMAADCVGPASACNYHLTSMISEQKAGPMASNNPSAPGGGRSRSITRRSTISTDALERLPCSARTSDVS